MIKLGKYLHYKGNLYEVIGEGVHTETREPVVIYKILYETDDFPFGSIWVRPKEMFLDNVELDGKITPRFKYIGDE
ncbi:MAG: DUF1653 domain-containing protein [Patescibacteria group bacterium]|jgi:hypothetical protein